MAQTTPGSNEFIQNFLNAFLSVPDKKNKKECHGLQLWHIFFYFTRCKTLKVLQEHKIIMTVLKPSRFVQSLQNLCVE